MRRIHFPALGGLVTTLGGIVASPLVLGIVPPHWAAAIVAIGSAAQSVTKAIHTKNQPDNG